MCNPLCVWCGGVMVTSRTSEDGDATEYRCRDCSKTCVFKLSEPGSVFAFFPDDIAAACSAAIKPLFPQVST